MSQFLIKQLIRLKFDKKTSIVIVFVAFFTLLAKWLAGEHAITRSWGSKFCLIIYRLTPRNRPRDLPISLGSREVRYKRTSIAAIVGSNPSDGPKPINKQTNRSKTNKEILN